MTTVPMVPSERALELAGLAGSELTQRMYRGRPPDPSALAGWEYLGLNTARWLSAAGADRFVKGFAEGYGYNRRVRRGARTEPWIDAREREPAPFAFYRVADVDATARDNRYLNSLLLDYSAYASGAVDPAGRIRDFLVAVDDAHELLLGHAFLAVGRLRVSATFFVIERFRRQPSPVPAPPRR
jgi:hypothetical protein